MKARGDSLSRPKTGEPSQKYGVSVKDGEKVSLYFYDTRHERLRAIEAFRSAGYECNRLGK